MKRGEESFKFAGSNGATIERSSSWIFDDDDDDDDDDEERGVVPDLLIWSRAFLRVIDPFNVSTYLLTYRQATSLYFVPHKSEKVPRFLVALPMQFSMLEGATMQLRTYTGVID